MKLKLALLTFLAAAGVLASIAVAKPPAGHGHHDTGSTTGTTSASTTGSTTTTSGHHGHGHGYGHGRGKVLVCHKVGNGHYVLISVSAHSAPARGRHRGDVLAGAGGTCPGPVHGHGTTTAKTTTAATTTS